MSWLVKKSVTWNRVFKPNNISGKGCHKCIAFELIAINNQKNIEIL